MAKKHYLVFLDDGHGKNTPGKRTPHIPELGRSIRENEFNKPVVEKIKASLSVDERLNVVHVSPGDEDTPLRVRTDRANAVYEDYAEKYGEKNVKAVYVSVHFNAFDGSFGGADPSGISVFSYPESKECNKLAECLMSALKGGTMQIARGEKYEDFWVLRKTHANIAAALTENGFMDNKREAMLMLDEDFQDEVASEHVEGIYKYFKLKKPKPKKKDDIGDKVFYRVVTGSFDSKDNAEKRMAKLKKAGFDSFILPYHKK